jgi:hypothetical protein
MLANDYFSHYSLDNRTPTQRMNNAGFFGTYYGENIAYHSGSQNSQTVFDMWKNSPGHYTNMMNSNYNYAGIGIAEGYWDYDGYTHQYFSIYTLDLGRQGNVCTDGDTKQCGQTDAGRCEYGTQTCSGGIWGGCIGAVYPITEVCDNLIDDDCDGSVDEYCNCYSHNYTQCYNNDEYWYDACNRKEGIKQDCGTAGCSSGVCCTSHVSSQCYSNDVYWYSSCSIRQEKKEECYTNGCVNGECVPCDSHEGYTCYGGDVYWYNSCNVLEEKKEECEGYGCTNNACNPPPCNDFDKDGHSDISCGGDDCDDLNSQKYHGSVEICNSVDEDCDGSIDEDCRENLIIVAPDDDSEFNTSRILIILNVTHVDGNVMYKYGSLDWRTFCSMITNCRKTLSLPQGNNQIDFKLIDYNGDEYTDSLNLYIDSVKPRLIRQTPLNKKYTNGLFTAKYTELNLELVELYIAESGSEFNMVADRDDCESGVNKECSIEYDVSEYDGESILYYFVISDRVSSVSGKIYNVTIDTTDPVFTNLSFVKISETAERYKLVAAINEPVKLEYQYDSIRKTLCSKCTSLAKTFYFSAKPDYIDFIATDLAGNQETERIDLE